MRGGRPRDAASRVALGDWLQRDSASLRRRESNSSLRAVEAHSGEQAVALLPTLDRTVQPVSSDISMPGMSGEALAAMMAKRWPQSACWQVENVPHLAQQ